MMTQASILIVTIGGQPQILTFALDELLRQGETISEVIAVHPDAQAGSLAQSLQKLIGEFANDQYRGQPCRFRHLTLRDGSNPLADIQDDRAAEATWQTMNELIAFLKTERYHLHLVVTGGPRMIGLMATSVAMLHFDLQDRLWHLYTPPPIRAAANRGARLHVTPDEGVRLIRVPIAPWGAHFPALRTLTQSSSSQIIAAQMRWLDSADYTCCQSLVQRLTPRQMEVLRAFAAGLTPQDVAERLSVTIKTVDAHKTTILAECRNAWNLPEGEWLSYHFLREKFGRYFEP